MKNAIAVAIVVSIADFVTLSCEVRVVTRVTEIRDFH